MIICKKWASRNPWLWKCESHSFNSAWKDQIMALNEGQENIKAYEQQNQRVTKSQMHYLGEHLLFSHKQDKGTFEIGPSISNTWCTAAGLPRSFENKVPLSMAEQFTSSHTTWPDLLQPQRRIQIQIQKYSLPEEFRICNQTESSWSSLENHVYSLLTN